MEKTTLNRILKLLTSPFVIAIPFALITILLQPVNFNKYKFELISKQIADKLHTYGRQFYVDLDNDGNSEEISNFMDFPQMNSVKVTTKNNIFIDQWNFLGEYNYAFCSTFFADYDHDSLTEIFNFYNRHDSIFLGAIQPFNDKLLFVKDFFIDTIWDTNGKVDFAIDDFSVHDLDKDGFDEIVFDINAGFSKYPRRLYAWNVKKNQLLKSPNTGFKKGGQHFIDINSDGFEEIFVSTYSQDNIKPDDFIAYPDNCLWFCALKNDLSFLFPPKEISGNTGSVTLHITNNPDLSKKILVEVFNRKSVDKYSYFYFNPATGKFDTMKPDFKEIKGHGLLPFVYKEKPGFLISDYDQGLYWMNKDFVLAKLLYKTVNNQMKPYRFDIGGDSLMEFILFDGIGKYTILPDNFKHAVDFELPIVEKLKQISIRHLAQGLKHLVIQIDQVVYEFNYRQNPFFWLRWPFFLAIYSFYVFAIWIILHFQNKHIENKYKLEKNLAELRLKSIRNQMDPHFTFNAINAVGAAIFKEDKQTAYTYFSKFSKLIRLTMIYSDRMSRSLNDEIDFTVIYLEIEKFRYKEKFNYQINIDAGVELNMEVPRMALQTFAESAVNNGLMHRTRNGMLDINISMENNFLILSIADNGPGIETSKLLNKEKAFKSMKIIDEFFSILNRFNREKIVSTLADLTEDGSISGTRAIVKIPVSLKYSY